MPIDGVILAKDGTSSPVVVLDAVAPIKPKIQLGISTRKPKPSAEVENSLVKSFGDIGLCSCCGVEIVADSRKTLHYEGGWFSVCQLCFYTENLDLIPMFDKGQILYQGSLEQTYIFTLIRAQLDHGMLVEHNRDDSPDLEEELMNNNHTIFSLMEKLSHASGKPESNNVDSVDTYIHLMDILKPDQYDNRFMFFIDLRWIPHVRMMSKDSQGRTTRFFEDLHPEKTDGFIDTFMSKYKLPFSLD